MKTVVNLSRKKLRMQKAKWYISHHRKIPDVLIPQFTKIEWELWTRDKKNNFLKSSPNTGI